MIPLIQQVLIPVKREMYKYILIYFLIQIRPFVAELLVCSIHHQNR